MQYRIEFPATGAAISAIASDYAGAAGANPTISCFDELWGYTSERSRRLWDEMIPSPARKISCRFTSTYAGFEGESTLLEELHGRGRALPQLSPTFTPATACCCTGLTIQSRRGRRMHGSRKCAAS